MEILYSHSQWNAVKSICEKLKASGYRSYLAGGAVRDGIIGRLPNDLDIATDATPEQVEDLFERVVMVGKSFGVCRVVIDGTVVEVVTFREDGLYVDGRRPESIKFSDPKEDALRRDFTVNGMFYDLESEKVVDYVEGRKDLVRGILRAIGDPELRFREDKLRILRGLRFFSQLEFPLEEKTQEAMALCAKDLGQVSQERITQEWEKLLMGPGVIEAIELSHELKIWDVLFGDWPFLLEEYEKIFGEDVLEMEPTWALWFLMHWRDDVQQMTQRMLKWKLPKTLIDKTQFAANTMRRVSGFESMEAVDIALFIGQGHGLFAAELYPLLHPGRDLEPWLKALKESASYFESDGSLPKPLVSGKDLIARGVSPGPDMAEILKTLYREQLARGLQDKEALMVQFQTQWGV